MTNKSKIKIIFYILLIISVNIIAAIITISCYKNYSLQNEARRLADRIEAGEVENSENICGMVFDYKIKLGMESGDTKDTSGTETYYWDGKNFSPISEFMKGYE